MKKNVSLQQNLFSKYKHKCLFRSGRKIRLSMTRKLLKLTVVAVIITGIFAACEKKNTNTNNDNNNTGNPADTTGGNNGGNNGGNETFYIIEAANVLNTNNSIATVKALSADFVNEKYEEIASAEYKNSGFKLNIPETLADKHFYNITNKWSASLFSDASVKIAEITSISAYNQSGGAIGTINRYYEFADNNNNLYSLYPIYVYANKAFTATGLGTESYGEQSFTVEFDNCSFKKGWNILYVYDIYDEDEYFLGSAYSTQIPSGLTLNWYFFPTSASTKSLFSKFPMERKMGLRK